MKVVLFCGGLGTRIREYGENTPKPMIPVGNQPILWHVMQYYSGYGHRDFILCLGYKANVIPGSAEGAIDLRYLPGEEEAVQATLRELAGPHVRIEPIHADVALEVPFEGELVDHMVAAIDAEDPGAVVLPYMLSGGTDNKSLSRLGITGYGFAPLQLPPELDFAGMFHGVDERVPVDALHFGVRVLERLLRTA